MTSATELRQALEDGEFVVIYNAARTIALPILDADEGSGEKIWWCLEHKTQSPAADDGFNRCYEWWLCEVSDESFERGDCSLVERILIPVGES